MAALVARGLLRRPSLSGTSTVTFCSVHLHSAVAKKRDASTDLLRRLHADMAQNDVDFIGAEARVNGKSTPMAASSLTTPSLALGPETKQLTFLFSFSCAPETCLALTASRAVPKTSKKKDRAVGKYERKRLRKQLAQQSAP